MSRHPSPGPSHPAPQNTQQAPSAPSARRQRPTHTIGIAAGAEDVKYQGKYKDLKRKVKEIEADNDKIHFKILQAKRSIQRMKLERAILYERLATAASPDVHDRHPLNQVPTAPGIPLPPSRSYSGSHQNRDTRDRPMPMDSDPVPVDYLRPHGNPRASGQDPTGRPPVPTMDPPMGPGLAPSPHMSSVHSPGRNSAGHDTLRHLPPLPHLPPVGQYEGAGARSHSLPHPHAASPTSHHAHPNSSSSHERGRSQSSRSHQPPPQSYPGHLQQYPDHLPPVQRVLQSPPPHSDRDRPPRRHEGNDYPSAHNDPHMQHSRHSSQVSPRLHSVDTRTPSSRAHPHQRMGPGTYINREDSIPRQYDMERERDRDRDRERERDARGDYEREHRPRDSSRSRDMSSGMHSPHATHRRPLPPPLPPSDYSEPPHSHHPHSHSHQNLPPRIRDEGYYHEGNPYPSLQASRSDTPGSGSGSGSGIGAGEGPSRPDSRTQFYDQQDRNRPSYRLRPVGQPNNNEDTEFAGHEDMRSQSRDSTNAPPRPSSPAASNLPGSGANNGTGSNSGGGGNNYHPPTLSVTPTGSGIPPSSGSVSEQAQQQGRMDQSRKRSRNEMEVDSEDDVGGDGGAAGNNKGPGFPGPPGGGGKLQGEDRDRERDRDRDRGSSKRYHREHAHRRSVDNHEPAVPLPAGGAPQDQDRDRDSRMAAS